MSSRGANVSQGSAQSTAAYGKTFFRHMSAGSRQSAAEVVPLLLELISPTSVIDVGCGSGTWLAVLREHGLNDFIGVDGAYVNRSMLEIAPEKFIAFDLRQPLRLDREFSMVMSLEVAEHLPEDHAEAFVDSLVRLGPVIVFSAAVPLQGGTHHVNEQWPYYWADLFEKRGYVTVDCLRHRLWQNPHVDFWYAQNMLIFVQQEQLDLYPRLQEARTTTALHGLAVVHPRLYLAVADPKNAALGNVLAALPFLVGRKIFTSLKQLWRA